MRRAADLGVTCPMLSREESNARNDAGADKSDCWAVGIRPWPNGFYAAAAGADSERHANARHRRPFGLTGGVGNCVSDTQW